jgi:signal transduction histidine kinase/CheY-like chemotaxis protein
MYKKLLIHIFLLISFIGYSQNNKLQRNPELDSLIDKITEANDASKFYEVYNIAELIIDTVHSISGVDSNYYLGMGYAILAQAYEGPNRNHEEGRKLSQKAKEHYEICKDPRLGYEIAMTQAYNLAIQGKLNKAVNHFHIAKNLTEKHLEDLIIQPLLSLSYHYRHVKNPDSSLFYLEKIKSILDKKENNNDLAKYYYALSEHYFFYGGGSPEEACLKAINLISQDQVFHLNMFLNSYFHTLSRNGKYKKAYEYQGRYVRNLESILNNLTETHITTLERKKQELEIKTKLKSLKLQNEFANEKSETQKQWIILVSILAIIILIGSLFLLKGYKKQQSLLNQLDHQNKELEESKNQALELAKMKSKFSETVSHELRTPLYGVIGLTSILISEEKENISEKGREYLDSLKFSGDYLLNLINDVLQISKVDAKKVALENNPFDIKFLVSNLSSSFQYLIDKNEIEFSISVDDNIPRILNSDAIRLSQIIINLVGNGIKFTKQGEVSLNLNLIQKDSEKASILFEVNDTGIGIPQEKHELIFEKFGQLSTDSSFKSGTGLGLPIVKELLKLFNSEIHLESELGKGSRFWFTIEFDYSENPLEQDDNNSSEFDIPLLNKTVLVVDDNKINRIVTENILKKYNYNILLAENGEEALAILDNHTIDLVLMDLHMPVMDGKTTTVKIRETNKQLPIILLTASNIDLDWEFYKKLGFNDYIIKPFDKYDFIRKIIKY